MAREAGCLVGGFHAALDGFDYRYRSGRSNVHDTPAHLRRLGQALERHGDHRLYDLVSPLAERLLHEAEGLVELGSLPLRHAHGDLKISNLLFDESGRGLCLIDLDTLTLMHWPLEMGDALRSWCNPATEEQPAARLDLTLFEAAIGGYREGAGDLAAAPEWEALVPGLTRICLELAARFLADALNESYFGWDSKMYPGRGEHNLARGQAMWVLYRDVAEKRAEAELLVKKTSRR
jgi:Ser/Thr protein kinase RdoA (MazF antagonist)